MGAELNVNTADTLILHFIIGATSPFEKIALRVKLRAFGFLLERQLRVDWLNPQVEASEDERELKLRLHFSPKKQGILAIGHVGVYFHLDQPPPEINYPCFKGVWPLEGEAEKALAEKIKAVMPSIFSS